jgi:hypothetical protein
MRYRLRTLLILMAVLPPLLAVAWWVAAANPMLAILLAIGYGPLALLVGFSWLRDKSRTGSTYFHEPR